MAWIVGDGFDYYGAIADLARSVWDSATTGASGLQVPRFGAGQSWAPGTGNTLVKNVGSNEATIYVAFAYYRPNALSGTTVEAYMQFRDGVTAQCTVVMESSGNIVLKSGIHTGTVLATYTGAFVQDVWTHFQIKIVISNTAGSMTVRKNGQTSDTYASATTLNTRGGTANNYANAVVVGTSTAAGRLDDVLFYSGSGAAPNDWVGDIRAVNLPPQADTAVKSFTTSMAPYVFTLGTNSANFACAANTVIWSGPFTPARSGLLTQVAMNYNAATTGNTQLAIYANDGLSGIPGTLLASSTVVVNPAAGSVAYPFSGFWIAQGRSYYYAWLSDVAAAGAGVTGVGAPIVRYTLSRTYALGFPASAGALGASVSQGLQGTLTLTGNVVAVSEAQANSDTDYVFDAVVNDEDLYDMDDLPSTPWTIVGVVSRVFIKKSDAGARSGQVRMRSGATDVAGTDTVLGSTYTYLTRVDTVDPATGIAWTAGGVNAIKVGQKVTA